MIKQQNKCGKTLAENVIKQSPKLPAWRYTKMHCREEKQWQNKITKIRYVKVNTEIYRTEGQENKSNQRQYCMDVILAPSGCAA